MILGTTKKHWRCNPTPPAPPTRLIEILPLIIVKSSLQTGEWYVLASTTPAQPPPTQPGWIYHIRLLETPRRSVATSKLMESKTSNERPPNRGQRRWLRGCCCWKSWVVGFPLEGKSSNKGWDRNYVGGRDVDFQFSIFFFGIKFFEWRKGGGEGVWKRWVENLSTHFGAYAQRPNWEFFFFPLGNHHLNLNEILTWMF